MINANNKNRKKMRLAEYDYSQDNYYFITIVCYEKQNLLSDELIKEVIQSLWRTLPNRFNNVKVDEFVIMPNHVHGIIIIEGGASPATTDNIERNTVKQSKNISDIICEFKSISAVKVNKLIGRTGLPLWQRSYFDHVIRNERDLYETRNYIRNNPLKLQVK